MLASRQCPHTGVVNFFAAAEPFMAIGSVVKAGEPARYHWRFYLGQGPVAGVAADMRTAESRLFGCVRESESAAGEGRYTASALAEVHAAV
jgi:hypothetical protein